MSEDDAIALEQKAEAQKREDFEARFPPRDFLGVAEALNIHDPAIFARLVRTLRDDFYVFYMNCRSKRPSRATEITRLQERRDAAKLLVSPGPWWMPLNPLEEAEEEQFLTTARRLATFWDEELTKLGDAPPPVGRHSHEAFHELIVSLIRTYQRITRKQAKAPSTRFGKKGYHGDFYQFAIAAWRCLRDHLPEAAHLMPKSEGALAEKLRDRWPKNGTAGYKLILLTAQ